MTTTTSTMSPTEATPETSGFGSVLSLPNFRLLWLGEGISMLGDQFYLIALPWLVLRLTGDAFAMGTVLALAGIPRALFMLVGGAITDRFSPRLVMFYSNIARMLIVAVLTVLVLLGSVQLWMLYLFALIFGLADAFFYPAQSSIIPQVVPRNSLQSANAIVQGTGQLSLFAGPVLAGILIALFDTVGDTASVPLRGIAIALGIDALTFLISAMTLWFVQTKRKNDAIEETKEDDSVIASMLRGFSYVWQDKTVRGFFILIAAANVLIVSPMAVGIPVLADSRFPEGAAAFGILMSAMGGGSLIGIILAGALPKPPASVMGMVIGVVWSMMGIATVILGFIVSTPLAAVTMFLSGLANGYVSILFVTWLQERTPDAMLGRVMSLFMFALIGLQPLGNALAGFILNINVTGLFVGFGSLMTGLVLIAMLNPALRRMDTVV